MRKDNKHKGDNAEIAFLYKTNKLGFIVSQPFGEHHYDFVVDWKGRLSRVQIKSCHTKDTSGRGSRYKLMLTRGTVKGQRTYSLSETDFVVGYVAPEDAFYILPIGVIAGKFTISLYTAVENSSSKYEKYRENWELLE